MQTSKDIYEKLLGDKKDYEDYENFERVNDRLNDLVILASDIIANQVNSQEANEQIQWLLDQGFLADEIEEFVGRC